MKKEDLQPQPKASIPLFEQQVPAGFPTRGDNQNRIELDLNEHLIKHPEATFFVRVEGSSMIGSGIHDGDLLIVDRSLEAKSGDIVLAILEGDFFIKRLVINKEEVILESDNPSYPNFTVSNLSELTIWGVAISSIHSLKTL